LSMKVYLSGNVSGSYRCQNILKVLGDSGIQFCCIPSVFFNPGFNNKNVNRVVFMVLLLITVPIRLIMILFASQLIVLPMNFGIISLFEVFFAKILRKKVVVDYYISSYDTLVNDRKLLREDSFRAKWALFTDQFILKSASTVIFLNESESKYYRKIAGISIDSDRIKIVPLCVDYKKELFGPRDNNREDSGFNVCWWGTYIPLHGLEHLIEAFRYIEDKSIKLYLFGDSEEKSTPYRALIEKYDLSGRISVNNEYRFSNGKLSPFLKDNCDLAIGNFGSSEKAKTVLVNKLVDSLSLGLPCLTMETRATQELLANNEGIILTQPNAKDIAKTIVDWSSKRSQLNAIGSAGKKKYLDTFSPDAFKVKLLSLLNE